MDIIKQVKERFGSEKSDATALLNALEAINAELSSVRCELERLREENRKLKEQLAKNSSNSSKPPSSDGLSKKPKNLRKKKGRSPGGQPGRTGVNLRPSEQPDLTEIHKVCECPCGCDLGDSPLTGVERRQVADLPPIKLEFTEHQSEVKICPDCGREVKAGFPEGVNSAVQYGPRVQAFASYLMNYQLIPFARCAELFKDLFGASLSEGSLGNFRSRLSEALSEPTQVIKNLITNSAVACFDESGMSVQGKNNWLHVASTLWGTYYQIHPKRGSEAMNDIGILPEFKGVAVHDHLSAYYKFNCGHAECNAHILRSLKFLEEERGQKWAGKMSDLLTGIKELVDRAKELDRSSLDETIEMKIELAYQSILKEGFKYHPPPRKPPGKRGRVKKSPERRMLEFLSENSSEILAFMTNFKVPFDNNLAERDIRMNKTKQKISGTFRGKDGPEEWCVIRSYISTARKNGVNVIKAITDALNNNAFIPSIA